MAIAKSDELSNGHDEKVLVDYNLEWDETFQMLSWWHKERVRDAWVMVVGAGALGNEVLKNLALLNVGHIVIVDYDTIEYANLCRSVLFREKDCQGGKYKAEMAAERLKEINGNIQVKVIVGDISCDVGLGLIRRMDVVIGCLDNRLARRNINRACYRVGKTWVDGAIENLMGKANAFVPGISCYECTLTPNDYDIIRYQMGCADVAKRNLSVGRVPTTPISSSIIAAVQVQEALKVIHHYENKLLADRYFFYEGMNNEIGLYELSSLKEGCLSHYRYEPVIEARELCYKNTVSQVLGWLRKHFSDPELIVRLDHPLVLEIAPEFSGEKIPLVISYPHLSEKIMEQYRVKAGERVFITRDLDRFDQDFPAMDLTLEQTGIPLLHILQVLSKGMVYYVELTGDEFWLKSSSGDTPGYETVGGMK